MSINLVQQLNLKSSFSKAAILDLASKVNIDKVELAAQLSTINKTMIGREQTVDLFYSVYVTTNTDVTGSYTPDELLGYIRKNHPLTCTGEALTKTLKEVWGEVGPTLKTNPVGFNLIKDLIVYLHKSLGAKPTTGVLQVRDALKLEAIRLYSQM